MAIQAQALPSKSHIWTLAEGWMLTGLPADLNTKPSSFSVGRMPSSKRKSRRKAVDLHEISEPDLPEASPSRPSPKKRKVNSGRSVTQRRTLSPPPPPKNLHEDSEDESETVSNSDLVDSVISYLQVAKEPVVATTEYSNEKPQPENKVSAYAKIAGRDWTYFVVDQAVNIGRPPDNNKDGSMLGTSASSPIADMKEMMPVHIDLGSSKIVSRHHACIFYDADHPNGPGWYVRVNGRNGVKVNTTLLKRGGVQQLKSGDILEIAGTQMMFVTPGDKVVVDPYFVERAKVLATGEEFNPVQHGHPDPAQRPNYGPGSTYPTTHSRQQIAPAPPDFKRTTTPPASQKDGRQSVFDSKPPVSPMYNRGMLMESTQEIDYSRDAAKDLKPPFSYATMIAQAIFSSDEEKLTLNNIYGWIQDKYAFYRHSNSGWQNSIRHNLSLNKAFQKVPRRTDEPGKGMKWQIAPEFREEYWKKQARRGVPASSSVPTSPASGAGKDINPNFRGPNGQNLGYDQSMVGTFPARDLMPIPPVPPHPASRNAFNSFPSSQPPLEAFTPERRQRTDTQNTLQDPDFDESPLPRKNFQPTPGRLPAYTLPSSLPLPQQSPANPTLSSSYLDTPFQSAHNIITPAPLRQNPRLAPPSTLVAPSRFMPDSSPAGGTGSFWKGLMSGDTPAHGLPDMSPVKGIQGGDRDIDVGRGIMSSSPPPMDGVGDGLSPSKPGRSSQAVTTGPSSASQASREEQNAKVKTTNGMTGTAGGEDDEEVGMGGFDLARGFQPIGSFHSHSSQSHAHGHANANAARASS